MKVFATHVIPLAFCLLLSFGCKEKAGETSTTPDTTATDKAGTDNGIMGMPSGTVDAVIVGQGVRSRENPSKNGTVLRSFNQGELVKIVDTSEKRESIGDDDECDKHGYHWYKVKDHEDKESWIFGKYVFRFQQMQTQKGRVMGGQKLTVGGKEYIFQVAMDQSYGPSDAEGLTGCDNFYIPFLYAEGAHNALLMHLNTKKIVADDLTWKAAKFDTGLLLLVAGSDGGNDALEEVTVRAKEPVLDLLVTHYYQDGSSTGKIVARVDKERIDVVEYENSGPNL